MAAYGAWCDQRQAWELEHPGVVLPETLLGDWPMSGDVLFPYCPGTWRNKAGCEGWICDAHGWAPQEHPEFIGERSPR